MIGDLVGGVIEISLTILFERWPWRTLAVIVTIILFVVLIVFLP